MERKVKGALLKVAVKGIRSDKKNKPNYDLFLSDKAKELLNIRILDSIWYSFETYLELLAALAKIYAKYNNKIFLKWGQEFGEHYLSNIYKNLIVEGKLEKLIDMYPRFHYLFYNFGSIELDKISNNEIIITYKNFEPKCEFWYYTSVGWMQKSIEMCIKKKVNFEFLKKSWIGDDFTQYKLFWSS